MNLIDSFLLRYAKEYDYYHELAHQVAMICESLLHKNGIRAIVTYRAKKPDSLREKLNKRNATNQYQSIDQIYNDIIDLSGVRIAIYFSSDRDEIGRLIESEFINESQKKFPNNEPRIYTHSLNRKFQGYDAIHYRVKIKEEKLDENVKHYAESQVEIQIASALMHAWAEVEHDLVYKPKIGGLSDAESVILDELNGIILSGENALERLQKSFKQRVSAMEDQFDNHYELAGLIRERFHEAPALKGSMGRVDILLYFLKKIKMDNPISLTPYLEAIKMNHSDLTITDMLVDALLAVQPDFYKPYIEAKFEMITHNPYTPMESQGTFYNESFYLNDFINHFIALENILNHCNTDAKTEEALTKDEIINKKLDLLLKLIVDDRELLKETQYIYSIRNTIIYSGEIPENEILKNAIHTIEKVFKMILQNADEKYKNFIQHQIQLCKAE